MKYIICLLLFIAIWPVRAQEQPHIFLILTDQQRGDCLGKENPLIKTPHLDALANDGAWFSNGYSSVPSCTPARAGMLTGMSPWQHGMLGYYKVAEKYDYEMPQMLRDNGYYTIGIGKMHWHPQRNLHGFHKTLLDESGRVESEGFVSDYRQWFAKKAPNVDPDATGIGWNEHRAGTYLLAEDLHPTYWTAQAAIDFVDEYNKDEPLFMKVSFARPHSPYDPPKRYLDMYEGVDIPEPYMGEWAERFANYPENKDAAFGDYGVEHAINSRRHYYAAITFIDDQIGRFINELKEKGMYDNALIIFVSDHGDMMGDHNHWRKTYAYEGSTRVPFIIKWPNNVNGIVQKGSELLQCVELRDILPTMLDVAGAQQPERMDGLSMMDLIKDEAAEWRQYIDLEHATTYDEHNYWCALTDGETKYVWFFRTGEEQLFNLIADKGEERNLVENKQYQKMLKAWRKKMVEHLKERGEPYVKKGKLQSFDKNILISPNYPQ
ncbi:arylsulfatase [Carboxylicivirga sediminis]|uniref:Arylsulfatase n=1 Tax=Carboxylicivirga sediminis TaxID=2006564 RepID=A0A941IX85_9BACT|nr:arylsulfatase [Carboxylicivirga sediminis]MBR8535348.1 arylsulfatase [Carboxylicivirga sediminis]